MDRFCFPFVVNTKKTSSDDYEHFTNTTTNITYIDIKALQDLKDSQKLINLSVINTDKLVSWINDLYITWPVILGSLVWTFVIALLYLFLVCMSVFGSSSDALMHAFLLDEEINKGQPKNFPELQKFMEDEK